MRRSSRASVRKVVEKERGQPLPSEPTLRIYHDSHDRVIHAGAGPSLLPVAFSTAAVRKLSPKLAAALEAAGAGGNSSAQPEVLRLLVPLFDLCFTTAPLDLDYQAAARLSRVFAAYVMKVDIPRDGSVAAEARDRLIARLEHLIKSEPFDEAPRRMSELIKATIVLKTERLRKKLYWQMVFHRRKPVVPHTEYLSVAQDAVTTYADFCDIFMSVQTELTLLVLHAYHNCEDEGESVDGESHANGPCEACRRYNLDGSEWMNARREDLFKTQEGELMTVQEIIAHVNDLGGARYEPLRWQISQYIDSVKERCELKTHGEFPFIDLTQ